MFKVLFRKELKRVFSDKRLVFSTFALPAISIFIVYTVMGMMADNMVDDQRQHTASVYVQNAPQEFKSYYETLSDQVNVDVDFVEGDKVEGIKNDILVGEADLLVVFEEDLVQKTRNYLDRSMPPEIKTYYNPSEDYSRDARRNFISQVLDSYESEILAVRFGDLNHVKAFVVDETNKESAIMNQEKAKGKALSMILPMLIGIMLFSAAMGIGMDTIAGEKERGTMATLLMTPVRRETIALGKVAGLAVLAILSALCSFAGILASMPFASGILAVGGDGGMPEFTLLQYSQLLLIMLSLVGINVGLICFMSVRARTVKEAATYVMPIFMIVMVAAFSTMFTSGTPETLRFAIPVYGNITAIKAIFNFELQMDQFLLTMVSSLIVAAILIRGITHAFNDEKIMLNA